MKCLRFILMLVLAAAGSLGAQARFNDKVLNRPYADMRRWHLGFSVGVHTEDLQFTNNGMVTDDGQTWFAEQPSFSPGFCVNGLVDFRLNNYFSVRISPGMYFGNKEITMRDNTSDERQKVNIKSAYVVVPIDLKYASLRLHNTRPYVTAGVMPAFDVTKKRRDLLQLTNSDVYLTAGFGLDLYLPYFKLIPELKFCFGLADVLRHDRPDLEDDPTSLKYTQSIKKAVSRMVVLTFYFE